MDGGIFDKNTQSERYQNISVKVVEEDETIDALLLDGEEVAKNGGANWSVSSGTTIVLKRGYPARCLLKLQSQKARHNKWV